MTNLFRKKQSHTFGAVTLIVTIILLVTTTLIIIFAAKQGNMLQKLTANQNRNSQAFEAAEAGLEFGINYLQQNSATILASPTGGYINAFSNASTTNVTLANNSKYSIVYTNPVANNYNLIQITSTGTSDDGSSTRVVTQQVQFGSVLSSPPNYSLVTKGALSMGGHSQIINTVNNNTVQAGGSVSLSGSSSTTTSGGTSSVPGNIKSDIQQNVSSIQSQSQSDYFATYFGVSTTTVKNNVAHYYSNSSSTNYSSTLNGMTGTSIWIDQTSGTATLNGTTTIGSSTNPVLLIINGNLDLSGSLTIYGFVFVIGTTTTDVLGNVSITGGMATTSDFNMTGNTTLTYSSTVLSNLQNQNSMKYYAKVAGSWKDF